MKSTGKRFRWLAGVGCVAVFLAAAAVAQPGGSTRQAPERFIVPLGLTPLYREVMPLNRTKAWVRDRPDREDWRRRLGRPGRLREEPERKVRPLEVQLRKTAYRYIDLRVVQGRAQERTRGVWCYELVPAEPRPSDLYTWALWSGGPYEPRWFWLYTVDEAETYLVFSTGSGLYLADVTRPRDRTVALHEDVTAGGTGPPNVQRSPGFEPIPAYKVLREAEVTPAFFPSHPNQVPTSLRRNENGDLVLSIDFPRTGVSGVMVKKNAEWEVLSYQASEDARREGWWERYPPDDAPREPETRIQRSE
ncbi:MAG: hypothetical protein ACOC7S_02570 [Planctomycetota bacterium]